MSEWIEIVVFVPSSCSEEVAAIMADEIAAARSGTELRSDSVVFWVTPATQEQALLATRSLVARLAAAGMDVDPSRVDCRPAVPESEWRDAWKRYFHVTRLTRQIVIVPSWEQANYRPERHDDISLRLDPGRAFGTGAHESTRLVLLELQALADAGTQVGQFLDMGCGSGILSIAAARLWPNAIGTAIDIDPIAVEVTRENCVINHVEKRVSASVTPVAALREDYPLLLANIQAHVLLEHAQAISAHLADGGHLLLSGLLSSQAEDVADEYCRSWGLRLCALRRGVDDPEWTSVHLCRASD